MRHRSRQAWQGNDIVQQFVYGISFIHTAIALFAECRQSALAERPLLHTKNIDNALRVQKGGSADEWKRFDLSVSARRQNQHCSFGIAPRADKHHIPRPPIQ
jgi:hypothetical protein